MFGITNPYCDIGTKLGPDCKNRQSYPSYSVCLFLVCRPTPFGDVTIAGERLQILTYICMLSTHGH